MCIRDSACSKHIAIRGQRCLARPNQAVVVGAFRSWPLRGSGRAPTERDVVWCQGAWGKQASTVALTCAWGGQAMR
eukprot:9853081-Alexandrium_andersonii.AAC.1